MSNKEEQYLHELIESYVAPLRSEIKALRKELAEQQVKNLNIPAVMGELTCDNCGYHIVTGKQIGRAHV